VIAEALRSAAPFAVAALALLAASCGGGGGSGNAGSTDCVPNCNAPANLLAEDDVRKVIAQAVGEAQARGAKATIAVVDRVGNVLAVYEMTGARPKFDLLSGRGTVGGLDGIRDLLPSASAAIAKAITGAYLSSSGNAFSTRTASQIVQENFLPGESQAPSGPLYGVQFSQLSCSDVNRNTSHGTVGPKRSPLGLSADPGGLPLYKNGAVVGGIGVMADGVYGLDLKITDRDEDLDELIAVAGTFGFAAPADIRAERITADGKTFRFVDSESLSSNPAQAPAFATLPGKLIAFTGYNDGVIRAGVSFGTPASGIRAAPAFASVGAFTLVDSSNVERFAPRAGSGAGALTAAEVTRIIQEAVTVANRARAQIRRPLGAPAEVTVSVVDLNGDILGQMRTPDAPVFGTDVSAQKARGALLLSLPSAAAALTALPPAIYATPDASVIAIGSYVAALRSFVGDGGALDGKTAWSMRAIGLVHRPTYPDGVADTPSGPLSKSFATWSPFNVGFQLDLVYNQLIRGVVANDTSVGCAGRASAFAPAGTPDGGLPVARNGIQIFPGGVPIYRGNTLIGAIGISGDGIDQDDMVAFLGLNNASVAMGTGFGNAPAPMRADQLSPLGVRLRYAQCPQAPFNNSTEQNVCAGL
jgi:uncharacterized protein GlcG (DUF336 family)